MQTPKTTKRMRGSKGAALVEFALILPLLLLILMGIIEFGIILYDKAIITNASREAARERAVFNAPVEDVIKNKIVQNYGSLPISFNNATLTAGNITFSTTGAVPQVYQTAVVTFNYRFLYLPIANLNMSSSTTMRQE